MVTGPYLGAGSTGGAQTRRTQASRGPPGGRGWGEQRHRRPGARPHPAGAWSHSWRRPAPGNRDGEGGTLPCVESEEQLAIRSENRENLGALRHLAPGCCPGQQQGYGVRPCSGSSSRGPWLRGRPCPSFALASLSSPCNSSPEGLALPVAGVYICAPALPPLPGGPCSVCGPS